MLFGRNLFWNDKCDHAFVEGVVIRVNQFNEHFVRTVEKTCRMIGRPLASAHTYEASSTFT